MRPSAASIPWFLGFVLAGCGGALSEPAPDARPNDEPATPNPPGLDRDPKNCGRRGHACDDATCTNGLCTPRVEATSATFPETTVGDLAVLDGDVWVALTKLTAGALVRFSGPYSRYRSSSETKAMLVSTEHSACSEWHQDCVVTDGNEVFLAAGRDPAAVRRFGQDGTPLASIALPDVQAIGPFTADRGRLIVRSLDGDLTAVARDGTVLRRLPKPSAGATFPFLSGDDVFVGDAERVQQISLVTTLSTLSTVGTAPGKIVGITADPSSVFALALPQSGAVASVTRISRNGADGPPARTTTLSLDTLAAFTTAVLGVPFRSGEIFGERPVAANGRLYFSLIVENGSGRTTRIIVEWSEAEGFLPFAVIPVLPFFGGAASLEISYGRLYWAEQASPIGSSTAPWRIVSLPL